MISSDLFTEECEDLFGSTRPEGLGPLPPASGGKGKRRLSDQLADYLVVGEPETGGGKPSRKKTPDHSQRTALYWEKLGYQCDRLDGWMMQAGVPRKRDFQGIWDMEATRPGANGPVRVLIQISSRGDKSRHLCKMTSDELAPDNKRPRVDNLRHCIRCGFRCVLMLWDQPDGHGKAWRSEIVEITNEMVDSARDRKKAVKK